MAVGELLQGLGAKRVLQEEASVSQSGRGQPQLVVHVPRVPRDI